MMVRAPLELSRRDPTSPTFLKYIKYKSAAETGDFVCLLDPYYELGVSMPILSTCRNLDFQACRIWHI